MEYLQLPLASSRGSFKLVELLAGRILLWCDFCEPLISHPVFNRRAVWVLLMCPQWAGRAGGGCHSAHRLCCSLHLTSTFFFRKSLVH